MNLLRGEYPAAVFTHRGSIISARQPKTPLEMRGNDPSGGDFEERFKNRRITQL
jgi:hypothetical protein